MQAPDEEEMAAVCREVDALLQHDGTSLGMHHVEQAQAHIYTRLTQHRQDTQALAAQAAQHKPDLHAHEAKALLSSLSELEEHAARAEHSVGEITAEIRWLDMAKRNVSQSIVTLRRLQMLGASSYTNNDSKQHLPARAGMRRPTVPRGCIDLASAASAPRVL